MEEQLQTALAEILSRATQGIDAGTQFLSAQLPDVIQQLLLWKLAYHLIPMLAAALVFVALLFAGWRLYMTVIADPRIAGRCRG